MTAQPKSTEVERVNFHGMTSVRPNSEGKYILHSDHIARIEELERDAARYRWLRERDLDQIHLGGVFAGQTPQNFVLNQEDLDQAIDTAMQAST